jgi:hypothetical protein
MPVHEHDTSLRCTYCSEVRTNAAESMNVLIVSSSSNKSGIKRTVLTMQRLSSTGNYVLDSTCLGLTL